MEFCPVCGCKTIPFTGEERWGFEADQCFSCGLEVGFNDDIIESEMKAYRDFVSEPIYNELAEILKNCAKGRLPKENAWYLLRVKWIKEGCKWNGIEEKEPGDWSIDKAREQLLNIGEKLEDYL